MRTDTFTLTDPQKVQIHVQRWTPDHLEPSDYRGIVQIAHGMGEYAARYTRLAEALTTAGYVVYANDHRGHGHTASEEDKGYIGADGFNWMVRNLAMVTDIIREEMPASLPLFLMGHSMGSFMTQKYMYMFPGKVDGIVLSGTNGKQGPELIIGHLIASSQASKRGDRYYSKLLYRLTFGDYNRKFKPIRTKADWISHDEVEVDAYLADPMIIHSFTAGFYRDFLQSLREIHKTENMDIIPVDLPIYIFGGDRDPVGNMGKGIPNLVELYRKIGLKHVQYKLYSGGRHEMLNEINRGEVTQDLIAWLDSQTLKQTPNQ